MGLTVSAFTLGQEPFQAPDTLFYKYRFESDAKNTRLLHQSNTVKALLNGATTPLLNDMTANEGTMVIKADYVSLAAAAVSANLPENLTQESIKIWPDWGLSINNVRLGGNVLLHFRLSAIDGNSGQLFASNSGWGLLRDENGHIVLTFSEQIFSIIFRRSAAGPAQKTVTLAKVESTLRATAVFKAGHGLYSVTVNDSPPYLVSANLLEPGSGFIFGGLNSEFTFDKFVAINRGVSTEVHDHIQKENV